MIGLCYSEIDMLLSLTAFVALSKSNTFNGGTISADTAYTTINGSPSMVFNHKESPTNGMDAEKYGE